MLDRVLSGGQAGVDRAALDVALELGYEVGGWCPRGRLAEDGPIDPRYPLRETESDLHAERTRRNVRDADHTLVLTVGRPSGWTAFTLQTCRSARVPHTVVDLARVDATAARLVREILAAEGVGSLNVAGRGESEHPGVYGKARAFLLEVLRKDSAI